MTSFSIHNLIEILPVAHNEVFDDVTHGNHGNIHRTWLISGHLLVSCDNGSTLFSFDCVPVNRQQNTDQEKPVIENLTPPILDIITSQQYQHVILVVQENGHVQCLQFTQSYEWDKLCEFDICNTAVTQVVSVSVHPSQNTVYWCETRTSTNLASPLCCVCKRSLPSDVDGLKKKDVGPAVAVVHNCPPSDVFPVGNNLFISSRPHSDSVHISLVISHDVDHVTMFVGDSRLEMNKFVSSQKVDFRSLLLHSLSQVTKTYQLTGVVDIRFDHRHQTVAVLYADGNIRLYQSSKESKNDIMIKSGKITHRGSSDCPWFLSNQVIGFVSENIIRIYDVLTGTLLTEVVSPDRGAVKGFVTCLSLTAVAGFYTEDNFYLIQREADRKCSLDFSSLSERKYFQTDALHIVHLNQMRHTEQTSESLKKLEDLHEMWKDEQTKHPKTKLSQIVDPYLSEFWRLEELFLNVFEQENITNMGKDWNVRSEIHECLSLRHNHSLADQEAKLLWMSEWFPDEMLQILCEELQFDKEDDGQTDMTKWCRVLGLDDDGVFQTGSSSLYFDHICRLLFKLDPLRLIKFVKQAQRISEQTVGVSAFLRKKHTNQYYKRAVSCLPGPDRSCDPAVASQITAELILACGEDNDIEKALKLLLHYKQWKSAVELVKNHPEKPHLIYITLTELTQHQELAEFAEEIFALVPTWQSFLTLSEIIMKQPDIRQKHLSSSASSVFSQGPPDIGLGVVRPLLLKLLQQQQINE